MAEIKNIQQLPESVRAKAVNYAEKLIDLHRENLLSVVVYGSAASGNFVPKVSDINLAVILKTLGFNDLRKSLHLVRDGKKHRISAPLFLTPDYIRQSIDVFPVEFLDLKDQHILLYGQNVLSTIMVDDRYLKLFCEEQIKGKLLRVRQAYLEIGLNPNGKEALLKDSLHALIPIFRNLLRLSHKPVPSDKAELLKALGRAYAVDDSVLTAIYRDRTNDEKIAGHDVDRYVESYINILEKLAAQVD
jgi:predicted nucleotidyltransferase